MRSKISRVSGRVVHGTWDWLLPTTDVPWAEVSEADLEPHGDPELVREGVRTERGVERHLGIHVRGEHVDTLGVLAIRCSGRDQETEQPESLAIAEMPMVCERSQADGAS